LTFGIIGSRLLGSGRKSLLSSTSIKSSLPHNIVFSGDFFITKNPVFQGSLEFSTSVPHKQWLTQYTTGLTIFQISLTILIGQDKPESEEN